MKDFAKLVSSKLPKEVEYGDVRVVSENNEGILVKNGRVENIGISENLGFGIRVLLNGCWGFASCYGMAKDSVDRTIKQAIEIAKASSIAPREGRTDRRQGGVPIRLELSKEKCEKGKYETPFKEDPSKVSLEDKISMLIEADKLLHSSKDVKVSEASLSFRRMHKVFASSEGSFIEQNILVSGGDIDATAIKDGELQRRSYGNYGTAGYEFIRELELLKNAPRVCEEASELLRAEPCPSGHQTVIIDSDQMVLQVHESIGHPVELDRVLGTEASYAGTSFVTIDKLDKFKYGSEIINVTANATSPSGLGTFGWDDEGIPAQVTPVIRNGRFVGYLTSRETSPVISRSSSGAMRADGWNRIPLIRMTNINLEPGAWKIEDLIADTKEGLFIQTNKSWSIDDMRENFQFGVEFARKIKDGKLAGAVKDVTYTGYTPEFWGSCDAVCNKDSWKMYGVMNCGKGEPGQVMYVGHGTTPARFRNVQVGVFRR